MRKLIIVIALALCSYVSTFAQATSLTVDNQTPGWLSSKINFGDQESLIGLKVTGFINTTDLTFIGEITKRNLKHLDLSDVRIVAEGNNGDNYVPAFISSKNLQYFATPLSATKIDCVKRCSFDTLYIGGLNLPIINGREIFSGSGYDSGTRTNTKLLVIRHGVSEINDLTGIAQAMDTVLRQVVLPITLKKINNSFSFCPNLANVILPDSIEEIIGSRYVYESETSSRPSSFQGSPKAFGDTIIFPKNLKVFYSSNGFFDKNNPNRMYWYFPGDSITTIITRYDNDYHRYNHSSPEYFSYFGRSGTIRFHQKMPPSLNIGVTNANVNAAEKLTIIVPQGYAEEYRKIQNPYAYAILKEFIPIQRIQLNEKYITYIGDTLQITATVSPYSAMFPLLKWENGNEEIAAISSNSTYSEAAPYLQNTILIGKKVGSTNLKAISVEDNQMFASTKVIVCEHTTGIKLQNSVSLPINNVLKIEAKTLPENISDGRIIYKIDNTDIATIDEDGMIKGISKGTCILTATTMDGGYSAQCEVTITQPVESISMAKRETTLRPQENELLSVNVIPSNADNKNIIWSTSDTNVITVDEKGIITSNKAGTAWVKAISTDNPEAKDSCLVTVIQPVAGVKLDKTTCVIKGIGNTQQLKATILPNDASNQNITWKSSNESVCVVVNGLIVVTGVGTAVVIATTEDGNYIATCTVTVTDASGIASISPNNEKSYRVFNAQGIELQQLQKGVNILRFPNGKTKKVLIK